MGYISKCSCRNGYRGGGQDQKSKYYKNIYLEHYEGPISQDI